MSKRAFREQNPFDLKKKPADTQNTDINTNSESKDENKSTNNANTNPFSQQSKNIEEPLKKNIISQNYTANTRADNKQKHGNPFSHQNTKSSTVKPTNYSRPSHDTFSKNTDAAQVKNTFSKSPENIKDKQKSDKNTTMADTKISDNIPPREVPIAAEQAKNDTTKSDKKNDTTKNDTKNDTANMSLKDILRSASTKKSDINPENTWADLKIHPILIQALQNLGYSWPAPVQSSVISEVLSDHANVRDLVVRAKNGTGKTLAYLLPLINQHMVQKYSNTTSGYKDKNLLALLLVPTRELAMQVGKVCRTIINEISKLLIQENKKSKECAFFLLPSYGGTNVYEDILRIKQGLIDFSLQGVISTPGRIADLLRRNVLPTHLINVIILDECDKMLSWEYGTVLNNIIDMILYSVQKDDIFGDSKNKSESNNQQTAEYERRKYATKMTMAEKKRAPLHFQMFSATFPLNVNDFVLSRLSDPFFINLMKENYLLNLSQFYCQVEETDKIVCLTYLLNILKYSQAIIFTNSGTKAERLAEVLSKRYSTLYLHGKMDQSERSKVYHTFVGRRYRHTVNQNEDEKKSAENMDDKFEQLSVQSTNKKSTNEQSTNENDNPQLVKLLVTTDLSTRGIDVPDLNLVVNFDMPFSIESYIHRIGRAGRFGTEGLAITFIAEEELNKLREVEGKLGKEILTVGDPSFKQFTCQSKK